jgi:hypothetical protein
MAGLSRIARYKCSIRRVGHKISYCRSLFRAGAVLRLAILCGTCIWRYHDRTAMVSVARTLARTGQIANAYMALPTGPTAHETPIYPILLNTIYRCSTMANPEKLVNEILASVISSARAVAAVAGGRAGIG